MTTNKPTYPIKITIEYGDFTEEQQIYQAGYPRVYYASSFMLLAMDEIMESLLTISGYKDKTESSEIGVLVWLTHLLGSTIPKMRDPIIKGLAEGIWLHTRHHLDKLFGRGKYQ